jgi:polyhydroxyalkanoate synthesis regulator protein
MQMLVPKFLEETMRTFVGNQERFQRQFTETFGGIFPINQFSEIGKQNMAMMERAMRMMNPFVAGEGGAQAPNGAGNGHAQAHAHHQGHGHGQKEADVTRLKSQLDELQKQINSLQKRPGAK